MESATDVLREEHESILRMLDAVDAAAARLRGGEPVDPELLGTICDFFSTFADGVHHAKEEEELFPALERMGIPNAGGPIGVMLAEHVEGRGLIGELREAAQAAAAGDASAGERWAGAAAAYSSLLRDHIAKENQVLFPTADQVLSPEAQATLFAAFGEADRRAGEGVRDHWLAEVDRVCGLLGVPAGA